MIFKLLFFIWIVFAGASILSYFSTSSSGIWILGLGATICAVILWSSLREKLRRKKEGYYVYKRGGAEDGILFYNEGNRILQFYFDRPKDTIYIPSDLKWKETMPVWASDRKQQIVSRVKQRVGKRLIGKPWTFEETDNPNYIVPGEGRSE